MCVLGSGHQFAGEVGRCRYSYFQTLFLIIHGSKRGYREKEKEEREGVYISVVDDD